MRQLLLSQVHFGLTTRLGQLLLRLGQVLLGPGSLVGRRAAVAGTAGGGGLSHFSASSRGARAGLVGLQAFQGASQSRGLLLQVPLLARESLELLPALVFRKLRSVLQLLAQPFLLLGQLGQLLFRLTQFLDQSAQFVFAAIGENILQLAQLVGHLLLTLRSLTDAVLTEVLPGLPHGVGHRAAAGV